MRRVLRRVALLGLLVVLLFGAVGCRRTPHERLRVAVSIFPIYDLVRRIAGDDADVALVLPASESPHRSAPPADAAKRIERARVLVMVGLGIDGWMDPLASAAAPSARVLKVGDRVPTRSIGDAVDPHVWLDPQRARLMITAISEELARADASHAIAFRQRAAALDASIAALDTEIERRTAPWTSRSFVSFHASMGYFAERYRLDVAGVVERTPGAPPSDAERAALAKAIADKKLRAIFREPQLPAAPAEAIARDAHVTLSVLDPLGGGATETDSYEKLIRFDAAALEGVLR